MLARRQEKKKDSKYLWTNHVFQKMAFYRLSESRVKRVLRNPARAEKGIAPETNASMQRNDSKKRKEEVWVMWGKNIKSQKSKVKSAGKIIIISAWRYPGTSPIGKKIEIPEDVLEDLKNYKQLRGLVPQRHSKLTKLFRGCRKRERKGRRGQ